VRAAPLPLLTRSGARVTLENLAAILERLGADACAVVSCTFYLRSDT
jgi:enamine deaminase RidA (YjgF/YER057c/UK114 family)